MRQPIIAIATITLSFALAACHNKPPAMPAQGFTHEGVTLTLDPPAAPDCKPNTSYRATLKWSVSGMDAPKTEVRLGKLDGQVFARSNDRTAHAETGDWVKPGLWFLLFNRKSGELLGAVQAGPKPCP
ncbi:MAG TPA: hypothetical protein VGT79_01255 [Xanthomonadaceae bacterium]|nr:hypothetical protein [Xanthomonadaceae bacterium]